MSDSNLLTKITRAIADGIQPPDPESEEGLEREATRLLSAYLDETKQRWGAKPQDHAAGRAILDAEARLQIHVLFAVLKQGSLNWSLRGVASALFARGLPWTADDLAKLLALNKTHGRYSFFTGGVLRPIQRWVDQGNELTPEMEKALKDVQRSYNSLSGGDDRKLLIRVNALLGTERSVLPEEGETWADMALSDLALLPNEKKRAWSRLFAQARESEGSKPSAAWRKTAAACIEGVGEQEFREHIVRWFAAVTTPPIHAVYGGSAGSDLNLSLLKGLAWMCADRKETETARAVARLVENCLKKIPGVGPWGVRAATGAVWCLAEMPCGEAVSQLGRLKTKVTFRTALNQVEKGLQAAAERAGVTKADLEDMCVPTYGFNADGVRREEFGECAGAATIEPTGDIVVEWFGANGRAVKSVPGDVKKNHAAALKEFKADIDAAAKMVTAQKARFDSFYLPERCWTLQAWQERFLDHPILGNIARRLIWHFSRDERKAQGIWDRAEHAFVDSHGEKIGRLDGETEVRLWHPIGFAVEDVLQWRAVLQQREIVQPFKQAYREVYLLTEAELRTNTYSNRFAGHILKQHQMNSLAALRGWKNKLRLMVDDVYPPATKELPELGLRAEFWIEGIGDNYGTDTTDSGTYLYLTTDQIRFYRIDSPENYAHASGGGYSDAGWGRRGNASPPLSLTDVPALVFSEILRDVDLFIGVCSVGNDPAWQDGGPQGQHQTYWTDYSFGDLSATAQTRKQVLERLLPRLKIAPRCTLTDKFLVVRGDIRTYKIHLGSGNILMEPNDEYLCIVQDRAAGRGDVPVNFLPFEGDQRLALILSKAFLLAADTRITDVTITRQIKRQAL